MGHVSFSEHLTRVKYAALEGVLLGVEPVRLGSVEFPENSVFYMPRKFVCGVVLSFGTRVGLLVNSGVL